MTNALENINEAKAYLAKANNIYEIVDIRDKAMAMAAYKDAQGASEAANDAKELQLRCERKAGRYFSKLEKAKPGVKSSITSNVGSNSKSEILEEIGVTVQDANRWEQIWEIPEEDFEAFIAEKKESGKELTTAGALRIARENNKESETPSIPNGKYRVIYADPPWKYGNTMPDNMGVQDDHYKLMTIQEICKLPVKDMAQDNSVLFLWATSPILEESFEVVKSWGFKYKSSFIWDKVKHVMGHYNSVRHEILLVCVRGSCQPDVQKLFDSVYSEERTEHSKKPEFFRKVIDTIYPNGKRIELFARTQHKGWDVWGNEAK